MKVRWFVRCARGIERLSLLVHYLTTTDISELSMEWALTAPAASSPSENRTIPAGGGKRRMAGTAKKEIDIETLAKLTLHNSQQIRTLNSVTLTSVVMPVEHPVVQRMVSTGRQYAEKTREGGSGHGLGLPHVHLAAQLMDWANCLQEDRVEGACLIIQKGHTEMGQHMDKA
eukprot:TRINITY_DN58989_c0_g1_i2.p2 TRINITY_DN58989_c0_g1~~TRINITY_DN58989_c0_g1_i2.p2  ORF type:complete len:172 (+),score=27.10 TRINITY_DN58989_c0_g1_i2:343-858(+)